MDEHHRLVALTRGIASYTPSLNDEDSLAIAIQEILNMYQRVIGRGVAEQEISPDIRVWLNLCEDGSRLLVARAPATFLYPYCRKV